MHDNVTILRRSALEMGRKFSKRIVAMRLPLGSRGGRGSRTTCSRAALYGQFVEAACIMYESAPNNPTPSPPSAFPTDHKFVAWLQMTDFVVEEGDWTFYDLITRNTCEFITLSFCSSLSMRPFRPTHQRAERPLQASARADYSVPQLSARCRVSVELTCDIRAPGSRLLCSVFADELCGGSERSPLAFCKLGRRSKITKGSLIAGVRRI